MNWKAISADIFRFLGALAIAAAAYALLRRTRLYEFTAPETEGLNTVILLVGSIYAVMFAFVIFVIWGQFAEVDRLAARECGALGDVARFSQQLHPDAGRAIRRAVADYAQRVAKHEWRALSERRRDRQAEKAFAELIGIVAGTPATTPEEQEIYRRLLDIVRKAGEQRDERITASLTRIPGTLRRLVSTIAGALLLLVFVYPFHHPLAGFACFALVALVLFLARVVMLDTDNPFEGVCNVSPQPFIDLATG